jgi:hypothetical protein
MYDMYAIYLMLPKDVVLNEIEQSCKHRYLYIHGMF